jgi:hypothetical protein
MSQIEMDFSRRLTEAHIQRAEDHANAVHGDWSDQAFEFLKIFLAHRRGEFMAEDFRAACNEVIPEPPSLRAYGAIILRAAKSGLIRKVGMRSVKNLKAHRAFASVWRKV